MASDVSPSYVDPCLSERRNSIESFWLNASDFGECYPQPSDSHIYPRLIPVYNGKLLNIESQLVHASLSGISIKHYCGKCYKESEDEEEEENLYYEDRQGEVFGLDWFDDKPESSVLSVKKELEKDSHVSLNSSGSFAYRQNSHLEEGRPLCTLPKINYRNSFWNVHRPELCKLTWDKKYVSSATVIEHLHEHLIQHGSLCVGFHTEEERNFMLNKELDDYVRLKVLTCPRELPPDEPLFNFKEEIKIPSNPRCKPQQIPNIKEALNYNERFFSVEEDEETKGKIIRRSEEEFCLTIGKHIRKPAIVKSAPLVPEDYITPELSFAAEEEASGHYYFNWIMYNGEESLGQFSDKTQSLAISISDTESIPEPCPPLMVDEFCRAAGKVDFSDIRCNPDF